MSNAIIIGRAVVNSLGHVVRVVECSDQRWVVSRDIAICLLLLPGAVGARIRQYPEVFAGHYRKARIEGCPTQSLLLSEEGARLFIKGMKRTPEPEGLESQLIAWFNAGALRSTRVIPTLYPIIDDDLEYHEPVLDKCHPGVIPQPRFDSGILRDESSELVLPKAPVLALVQSTPVKVPSEQQERTKAYCRELLKTLLRYANEDDAEHLVQVIESEVAGLLSHRYCQGLNDARYELYRRFWLQGGAV